MNTETVTQQQKALELTGAISANPALASPLLQLLKEAGNDPTKLEALTSAALAGIKEQLPPVAPAPKANPEIATAEKILSSLNVKDGFAQLTIPAGLSDIEAMKALNAYFREKLPQFGRAAIWEGDLDWYAKQAGVKGRDVNAERKINIQMVVPDTAGLSRYSQGKELKEKGMTFAAPEEVASVAAAYACKNNGEDIFKDLWVRTTVPGVALGTHQSGGVDVHWYPDDLGHVNVAASGAPLPN